MRLLLLTVLLTSCSAAPVVEMPPESSPAPALELVYFTAFPYEAVPGAEVIISWELTVPASVTITPGKYSDFDSEGSFRAVQVEATTYTLTATNAEGSVTETLTVPIR